MGDKGFNAIQKRLVISITDNQHQRHGAKYIWKYLRKLDKPFLCMHLFVYLQVTATEFCVNNVSLTLKLDLAVLYVMILLNAYTYQIFYT